MLTHAVLTVFVAASLHEAMPVVGRAFEARHPSVSVRFEFNGSQLLAAQLREGAPADVFASADKRTMEAARADGLVDAPVVFAGNSLAVIVNTASQVRALSDLSKPGLRLIMCAEQAPCGRYARASLAKLNADGRYGRHFNAAVMRNVVSMEENVESVAAKVRLREADAGFVYGSDAVRLGGAVRTLKIPQVGQTEIRYPIAVVRSTRLASLANSFVSFVRSATGHDIVRRFGFKTGLAARASQR
ncbi:MAG: molybdate ABC transporter substrate-binding protein [Candidatus Eremiobacteraeota bacterium]|nr:molybdate ABC transporter substrate-binding protein [Candidatus Eremiobacteraeota bacterium]